MFSIFGHTWEFVLSKKEKMDVKKLDLKWILYSVQWNDFVYEIITHNKKLREIVDNTI